MKPTGADIRGGFGENENQLAQVALAWMYNQATAAGLKLLPLPSSSSSIPANSVIHDKSDAIRFGSPTLESSIVNDSTWNNNYDIPTNSLAGSGAEDRQVRYLDGTKTTQRMMTGTGMTFADTEKAEPNESLITYDLTRSRPDNVTGTVDMQGDLNWLNAHGYGLTNLTVQ